MKLADEAGFESFHLAEHHGSSLCLAPSQEIFIAAASQVTETIRLGPMVKLLPLHHPVQIIEDMCVADQLTGGRLDFGVGRGVAPIEHAWFGSRGRSRGSASRTRSASSATRSRPARSRAPAAPTTTSPTAPLATKPLQDPIPFWYPGQPGHGRPPRHEPDVRRRSPAGHLRRLRRELGAAPRRTRSGSRARDGRPRVGLTLILAIAPSEKEALAISRRGVDGLVRRTKRVHTRDHLVLSEADCERAIAPLNAILAPIEETVTAGAGVPEQIVERLAAVLEARARRPHRDPGSDRRHDLRRGAADGRVVRGGGQAGAREAVRHGRVAP